MTDAVTHAALDAVRAVPSADWLAFLAKQRWFAGKGGAATDARVDTIVPLPWADGAFVVAVVSVVVDGTAQTYQLPLAGRPVRSETLPARAVVHVAETHGEQLTIYDAVEDPEFRRGLADAFAAGVDATGDGATWTIRADTAKRLVLPSDADIRLGSAEQSNTSIVFGTAAILKLFRRLEAGVNPDAEVTEFLSRKLAFAHTPALLGTIQLRRGADTSVAGMLQEFVPGARDGWEYTLACARPYFTASAGREVPNGFLDDARELGTITRSLHEALAGDPAHPAFAPEPATAADADRWAERARRAVTGGLDLLRASGTKAPEARILVDRRDRYLAWVDELRDRVGSAPGLKARVHGDYHLGQVLRSSSNAFIIIDFEGEPTRSLAERREKTSPLRDVACMLRSFAYGAATLTRGLEKQLDMPTRELRSGRWERDVRGAFLDGYLAVSSGLLPIAPDVASALIALFEAEKVFYELAYELHHRPEWVGIPMRGIAKLLAQ